MFGYVKQKVNMISYSNQKTKANNQLSHDNRGGENCTDVLCQINKKVNKKIEKKMFPIK